ncbi:MAG: DUF342 domain-containing protein [bacterium]|nr:DUF342 domain-containing protein [bacterium]
MLFPRHRALEIPEQLRQIKAELAHSFGVADHRLEYLQLIAKKHTRQGILVEMQIRRQAAQSGAVRVRFLPLEAHDGTSYSDMRVAIDVFPLDDYEQPVTFETVEAKLRSEGVDATLVQWAELRRVIDECTQQQMPLFDRVIASGIVPDVGQRSQLAYKWFPQGDPEHVSAWMGLREVEQGEDFLEHHLPVSGLKSGRNVFGRELSPRKGLAARLEAGDGVSAGAAERKFVASRSGVVFYWRTFADKRQKDSPCVVPAIVQAEVRRVRRVSAEDAVKQKWEEDLWVEGNLPPDTVLQVSGNCIVFGDVLDGCQLEIGQSLRVFGNVGAAAIGTAHHMCVHGRVNNAVCEVGLAAQIIGTTTNSSIYAREILADKLVGGVAEAYAQGSGAQQDVVINREKLLSEQREAGENALAVLKRQLNRLYDIFGAETVQQVSDDTVQMHLLRWLRKQKSLGVGGYTHPQVQEYRVLLEILPGIRRELTSIATELRATPREENQT